MDVNLDQTCKTILFKAKKSGEVFSVTVQGKDRISYKKLRDIYGKISTMKPDEMRAIGWEPGECCPLLVPGPLYVDQRVFEHPLINTGSGDMLYGLEFKPEAILDFRADVKVMDVREDPTPSEE